MPVRKVRGGYKVEGANKVHKTKKAAMEQLQAIKASQKKRKK